MPNVLIDKNKIDILANAIAAKSGEPLKLTLEEMVEAVDGIETGGGGVTPTGNIDITQAGVTDVTNYATATVPSGSTVGQLILPSTPNITVYSSTGEIVVTHYAEDNIDPIYEGGWIEKGTLRQFVTYGDKNYQLPTQPATTITPTTSQQTAVTSGKYTTGNIVVEPIPYADGDNEAYGTTSEIWLINASPTAVAGITTYNIDFISNNATFNSIELWPAPSKSIFYQPYGSVYNALGWTNQAYRTIEITGGTDKDNANWRAWLEANAVKQ